MAKKLTLDDIKEGIKTLSTSEQIEIKNFTSKLLEDKEAQAKAELNLINGGGQ